ncbi:MAG: BatD family protein [Chitinophagaceae bacterium]
MKRWATIFAFLFSVPGLNAQLDFKTIVPQQPVVSGESFQVQYIIGNGDKMTVIKPPIFSNFRFVTGPNIYIGSVSTINGLKPLKNTVFTLEAGRPGKFMIPGATVNVNGKIFRSNNAWVEVISKEEAIKRFNRENGFANSEYFLRPGEDVYEKIHKNLFIKVMVDKRNCYVGEPVLATFKLYSRLESKSDIVKNPGFYGFTVYDMVNLADKKVAVENINGKAFDVHTIRKVQLYPLQAGEFTIDPMEVKNKVEFSRSAVNKKTEQEIVEGVLNDTGNETPREGTEVVETDIHTEPLTIRVKPVPEKNKPAGFNGATGNFTIASIVRDNELDKNEEGFFEIKISGKGNFIQISAPSVQWPEGIEGFDPVVTDAFDKTQTPLTGSRTFRFPFVSSAPATYTMPAISFTFFNTDSGKYKTVSTDRSGVNVSNTEKPVTTKTRETAGTIRKTGWIYYIFGIALVLVGFTGFYWMNRKKQVQLPMPATSVKPVLSIDELLEPVKQVQDDDRKFFTSLQQAAWKFFGDHLDLSGSGMDKKILMRALKTKGIKDSMADQLLGILNTCEAGMFTNARLGTDKEGLLWETRQLLLEAEQLLI